MDSFELNKIFAAVLIVGIFMSVVGTVTGMLIKDEPLEEHAFKIEGVETAGAAHSGPKKPKLPDPVLALIATADVTRGQKLSKACAACHSFNAGGANGVGPNIHDIVNRAKGSVAGFKYSGALLEKGGDWNYESLNAFLWKPKTYIKGTKMNYVGLRKAEDRAAMIAWLRTLSSSPAALPSAADIAAEAAKHAGDAAAH